jgi:hypothetical protein
VILSSTFHAKPAKFHSSHQKTTPKARPSPPKVANGTPKASPKRSKKHSQTIPEPTLRILKNVNDSMLLHPHYLQVSEVAFCYDPIIYKVNEASEKLFFLEND